MKRNVLIGILAIAVLGSLVGVNVVAQDLYEPYVTRVIVPGQGPSKNFVPIGDLFDVMRGGSLSSYCETCRPGYDFYCRYFHKGWLGVSLCDDVCASGYKLPVTYGCTPGVNCPCLNSNCQAYWKPNWGACRVNCTTTCKPGYTLRPHGELRMNPATDVYWCEDGSGRLLVFTCHYIDGVTAWTVLCTDHSQVATAVHWNQRQLASFRDDSCVNTVRLDRFCNSLPTLDVTLTPSPTAGDTDNLVCTATATDSDGDALTYIFTWRQNGVVVGTYTTTSNTYTVSSSNTDPGDVWTCSVTVWDNWGSDGPESDNTTIVTGPLCPCDSDNPSICLSVPYQENDCEYGCSVGGAGAPRGTGDGNCVTCEDTPCVTDANCPFNCECVAGMCDGISCPCDSGDPTICYDLPGCDPACVVGGAGAPRGTGPGECAACEDYTCVTDDDCPYNCDCNTTAGRCESAACPCDSDNPSICASVPYQDNDCEWGCSVGGTSAPRGNGNGDCVACEDTPCVTDDDCPFNCECVSGTCDGIQCPCDSDDPMICASLPGCEVGCDVGGAGDPRGDGSGECAACEDYPCATDNDCPYNCVCNSTTQLCGAPPACLCDDDNPSICASPAYQDDGCEWGCSVLGAGAPRGMGDGDCVACEDTPCVTDDDCPFNCECVSGTCDGLLCPCDSDDPGICYTLVGCDVGCEVGGAGAPRGTGDGGCVECADVPCTTDDDCPYNCLCNTTAGMCEGAACPCDSANPTICATPNYQANDCEWGCSIGGAGAPRGNGDGDCVACEDTPCVTDDDCPFNCECVSGTCDGLLCPCDSSDPTICYDLPGCEVGCFVGGAGAPRGQGIGECVACASTPCATNNDCPYNCECDTGTHRCEAPPEVDGECGNASRAFSLSERFPGSYVFCSSGTPRPSTPRDPTPDAPSTWICGGANGGNDSEECVATVGNDEPEGVNCTILAGWVTATIDGTVGGKPCNVTAPDDPSSPQNTTCVRRSGGGTGVPYDQQCNKSSMRVINITTILNNDTTPLTLRPLPCEDAVNLYNYGNDGGWKWRTYCCGVQDWVCPSHFRNRQTGMTVICTKADQDCGPIYDGQFNSTYHTGTYFVFPVGFRDQSTIPGDSNLSMVPWHFVRGEVSPGCSKYTYSPTIESVANTPIPYRVSAYTHLSNLEMHAKPGEMCTITIKAFYPTTGRDAGIGNNPIGWYTLDDTGSVLCPSCTALEVPSIIHPIGIYSASPDDAKKAYLSAQAAVSGLASACAASCSLSARAKLEEAQKNLAAAEYFQKDCTANLCRISQYYSVRARELANQGMLL